MTDADRNPYELFADWLDEAGRSEPNDPNAMALATADSDGIPSVRMVLLKGVDERGFVFYTNMESRKGRQLLANPSAALCFHWKSLRRSVRVEGAVEQVSDAEADAYFDSRPRESRIGAWASQQSRPLEGRWELEKRVAQYAAKFAIGHIPRPPYWTGCRIVPRRIEFWQDKPFRLHERLVYLRVQDEAGGTTGWTTERLYP
ncbi:pyridoxamine 5'-phosphate oxidase [Azospirillum thermophilum]|uniref:Pyridoxine/pyridoxamine 5'-phosphate oxidase n=1 Tax=Azospirillum thermophilum TaxID=2202148 RepID=A0A2S2CMA8_9PROT|nr:pyridoxamine 5'-phosphate oxidase [Azospirillum thermophilum]AWK85634.1 pyridoxamine 5'-phosphate oxidase [Azospirillum thermophilum]